MYFSRTTNPVDILFYLILCALWWAGGWLLVTHAFRLASRERLIAGLGTGWLLFIVTSNLLAHFLPLTQAYWLAAVLILLCGAAVAWRSPVKSWSPLEDFKSWPQVVALSGITLLFLLIQRGLAIFDDYLHVPLTSTVGAGDVPPHFYVDPQSFFAYHYGLHLSAGALERIGGFFPWSAWDLSKAFAIALTLSLGWLLILRLTGSRTVASLGSFLITFGGGARWLLLLLPASLLNRISAHITMINTGADTANNLVAALASNWRSQGGGPIPFPFAFHTGVFVPVDFILGSNGALPFVTILVLLLLATRRKFSIPGLLVFSLAFASLALSAEHMYVFLWVGIILAMILSISQSLRRRQTLSKENQFQWGAILLIAGIFGVVQGGYLTETARNLLLRLTGNGTVQSSNAFGFALRWPPAVPTAHFAPLSLLNPSQLIVLLAELGPALLLFPMVTLYSIRCIRKKDWMKAGLGLSAVLGGLFTLFFEYGVDRSSTRLFASSLWIWVVLGIPILWLVYRRGRSFGRTLIGSGYVTAVFAGIVIFAVQLTAILTPQLTYFIFPLDAVATRQYWDRLEPNAQILDAMPERAVTVFGRASRAKSWIYTSYPDWEALVANPDPAAVASAGYSYIYMDQKWWNKLSQDQRQAMNNSCARMIYQVKGENGDFRRLYSLSTCKP